MGALRSSPAILVAALFMACAETETARVKAPPAQSASPQASESLAFQAERHINAAESELGLLHADAAEGELKAAKATVFDPRIDSYPDTKELRKRYQSLVDRVPQVREEVKKKELAAEVAAAKAKIDEAGQELKEALAAIKKKHVEDGDLKRAVDALAHVKTALEDGRKLEDKDLEFSKYTLSVQKDLGGTRKAVEQRQIEVSAEHARADLEALRASLQSSAKRLSAKSPLPAEFEEAKTVLQSLDKAVEGAGALAAKDPSFAKYLEGAKKAANSVRVLIDRRKQEVDAQSQKAHLVEVQSAASSKLRELAKKRAEATAADISAVEEALKALKDEIAQASAVEKIDRRSAEFVQNLKKNLARVQKEVEDIKHMAAFRDKPVAALAEGLSSTSAAEALSPADRKAAYTAAILSFRSCKQEGASMIAEHPKLASATFTVGKKKMSGAKVLSACAGGVKSADSKLTKVNATLRASAKT